VEMRRKRSCLDCGRLHRNVSRCDSCAAKRYKTPAQRGYSAEWATISKARRTEWVKERGLLCQGWQVPEHGVAAFSDLCLDHDGLILCRQCNGAKGGGFDRFQPGPHGGSRTVAQC